MRWAENDKELTMMVKGPFNEDDVIHKTDDVNKFLNNIIDTEQF